MKLSKKVVIRTQKIVKFIQQKAWLFLHASSFKEFGSFSSIDTPLTITGYENIIIGNNVLIKYKAFLGSIAQTGSSTSILKIGDGSIIGNFNHIYATSRIEIGKRVLTADRVYISDNVHGYNDITIPVMDHQSNKKVRL